MAGIAFIGAGFVADYYIKTLANHPTLRLVGVYDRDPAALKRFCDYYRVNAFASLKDALDHPDVQIVVNLTTPESHFEISRAALEAGKHAYSEKPLAVSVEQATALVEIAKARGLTVAAAPANALSAACAAVSQALKAGEIGAPRLIYAQMEDGPVFRQKWQEWRSESGAPWPGQHEFEVGCTLEHAGYALSWLVSLFGPVESLSAFSTTAYPIKGAPDHPVGPDYSVGNLVFAEGVVARLTCGLGAPKDRTLTILGDQGSIVVADLWDHFSPVRIERADEGRSLAQKVAGRIEARRGHVLRVRPQSGRPLAVQHDPALRLPNFPSRIDFCAGIAAQAQAIAEGKAPFFSGDVALHITELALKLSQAGHNSGPYAPRSTFSLPAAG